MSFVVVFFCRDRQTGRQTDRQRQTDRSDILRQTLTERNRNRDRDRDCKYYWHHEVTLLPYV